jgi:hypothetical protein
MLLCAAGTAQADVQACLKEGYGNHKAYKVQGNFISGSKLIAATGDYSKWTSYKTYFTVFWSQDQVTVLEMPVGYYTILPMLDTTVTDQEGRSWVISSNYLFCD